MTRRHVMGSEPPVDPVDQVRQAMLSVTTDNSIKFKNRKIPESWTAPTVIIFLSFIGVFFFPILVIILTLVFIPSLFVLLQLHRREPFEQEGQWRLTRFTLPKIRVVAGSKAVELRGEQTSYLSGSKVTRVDKHLRGDLASLVRGIYAEDGFCLNVSMKPSDTSRVMDHDVLHSNIRSFLRTGFSGSVESYMESHGYLWDVGVSIIGNIQDEHMVRNFQNSIKGALPVKRWKTVKPDALAQTVESFNAQNVEHTFYAVGEELSGWLVQMRSELTGEVGMNVPGQFYASIRPRVDEIAIGNVIHPDTLREGPPIGLLPEEVADGVLVCGGSIANRRLVLGHLIKGLLERGKRILILSAHSETQLFTALHDSGVGFVLGKNFVLNPVDNERVPRAEYVTQLLMSLEVLTEKTLTFAADLEQALVRAVALPYSTVADVKMEEDETISTESGTTSQPSTLGDNRHSFMGMEAVRRLCQGAGARAFYGTQTVLIERLTGLPLSVLSVPLGNDALENFAWDLLLLKLGAVRHDKDLVVVLDDPLSLRYTFRRFGRRETFIERLMRALSERFSLIVSIDRPSDIGTGVRSLLQSCISLRLKHDDDVASVTSTLSLNVVSSGLHSKARWSPRESAFLRTLDDGMALIVRDATETAQPVKLLPPLELGSISDDDMNSRITTVVPSVETPSDMRDGTLIERVGKGDSELTTHVLRLLERYEPLTENAVRKFIQSKGALSEDIDVEGILIRLKQAGMILEGHETHSGVSYKNYRLTMKGTLALRQAEEVTG